MTKDDADVRQSLLQRLQAGEAAARDELISRSYERLRRLAARMLRDFPIVQNRATTSDVLHETFFRLRRALEIVPLTTAVEFYRLAALHMRRQLLDMARSLRHQPESFGLHSLTNSQSSSSASYPEPGHTTLDPAALARWQEVHERVEALPEEERIVFDLLYYHELSQAEAAEVLDVSIATIKRRWTAARLHLAAYLGDASL